LLDSLEFHSPMFARRWRLTSQNGESTVRGNDPWEVRRARRNALRPTSGIGTKRTSRQAQPMSAFGGKADIEIAGRHVRF
jgi:hypothetical protein